MEKNWRPFWRLGLGRNGKEKKMEASMLGCIGATIRIHSFIPSQSESRNQSGSVSARKAFAKT